MAAVVPRLGPGTLGKRTTVITNNFIIERMPIVTFHQYDVGIEPVVPRQRRPTDHEDPTLDNPRRNSEILKQVQRVHVSVFTPTFVYDGKKSLYSPAFVGPRWECTVALFPGSDRATYKVTLLKVRDIDPRMIALLFQGGFRNYEDTKIVINLLQLILKAEPMAQNLTVTQRAVYPRGQPSASRGGIDIKIGFWHSVRPLLNNRLAAQIDLAITAMYAEGRAVDIARNILENILEHEGIKDRIDPAYLASIPEREGHLWNILQSYFKDLRFVSKMNPKVSQRSMSLKITSLVPHAGEYPFMRDGVETTVADYYRSVSNRDLAWPRMFGVKTRKGQVYPAELAYILPGQLYRKKLSPDVTSDMLRVAKKRPEERFNMIKTAKERTGLGYVASQYMHLTGMKVGDQPLEVPGRILAPPALRYGDNIFHPDNGRWTVEKYKFTEPAKIVNWAVCNMDNELNDAAITGFLKELNKCLISLGVVTPWQRLQQMPAVIKDHAGADNVEKALNTASTAAIKTYGGDRPSIIIVVLPFSAPDTRHAVKYWGDIKTGISTQCINAAKIEKPKGLNQYANNVALKINVKCGGINSYLAEKNITFKNWMVLGADVGHASVGAHRPSLAGLVYSVDHTATRYGALSSIQMPGTEPIMELKRMVLTALKEYHDFDQRKKLPEQVLFYRDGISEGEFETVRESEIAAIREAFEFARAQVGTEYPLKLTYIVVGKRHHTRFCPLRGQGDKSGNFPPGLVVDRDITNPLVFDFYLQSHAGLQGTVRPAHYTLLHDDNGFNADKIQAYTYALCHVYARATSAVSLPAPVYYADLVCQRTDYHYPHTFYVQPTIDSSGREVFDEETFQKWKTDFKEVAKRQSRSFYFI